MLLTAHFGSVLTRAEHIQAVFKDSNKHFKADDSNYGYLMGQLLGQCVGLVSGNQWRDLRAVVEPAFTRTLSTGYVALVEARMESHFEEIRAGRNLPRGLLDPVEDLKILPFLVVADIIYSKISQEMERLLRDMAPRREALFRHVGLARFSFSRFLPTEANKSLASFRIEWHAFNEKAYERALDENLAAPIIEMYTAVKENVITHEQLYQTLDEALFANLDVTLGGISWNVIFLAANPSVRTKIRAEVAAAREAANHQGGKLDSYFFPSTTFLSACILESACLRPIAAFSIPQSAPTPRLVSGYLIPARTNLVIDSHALNIRNPYWGSDSLVYRPERFLDRTAAATEQRYNYWRYGFGPRQCMVKHVADLVIKALMVKLVEDFELGLEKGNEAMGGWERDRRTWINHLIMSVRCERRERGV